MRLISRFALTIAAVPFFLVASASIANAQQGKPSAQASETRATKSKGAVATPASDRAVLNAAADRAMGFAHPTTKGGARPRGRAYFVFHYDNRTDYYLDCFFDGRFAGSMGPWGDIQLYVSPGQTSVMCTAPGTGSLWGPTTITIRGDYSWRLSP